MSFLYDFYAAATRRRRQIRTFMLEAKHADAVNKMKPGSVKVTGQKAVFTGTWSDIHDIGDKLKISFKEV